MTRKTRISVFVAVVFLALGVATSAFAYTHTGPFYDSAYDPQIWNYGIGVGGVSGSTTADNLSIPSSFAPGFEESALRDLGSCLECETWTGTPIAMAWISTNSYGSLKVAAGVSNRFFTISGNLGSPASNSSLSGEGLCGVVVEWVFTSPACMGTGVGYSTNAASIGLPSATSTTNYAGLGFQFTSSCSTTLGAGSQESTDVVIKYSGTVPVDDPAPGGVPVGNAARESCYAAVWNAYSGFGGVATSGGTFSYGAVAYHVFKVSVTDCKAIEASAFSTSLGALSGNNCYIPYALQSDLQTALEHTFAVPFTTQTVLGTRTTSPALTTTPNSTFVNRVRAYVDSLPDAYTNEWNCLLQPGSTYTCPTSPPPPPFPGDCTNVPKPLVGELYNDYVARLRADGYTGTTVRVDDPFWSVYPPGSDAAGLAPYATTAVTVLGGLTALLYDSTTGARKNWPNIPPSFCASTTEIDIDTAPSSSTGGGPPPGPGTVDFSPITSVSYGSAFPFGIFTWIQSTLNPSTSGCGTGGHLADCGLAPSFTITKPGGGSIAIDLTNTEWSSTYRAPVFDVIEFFIVVAAIWFLAWKVIGIGGSDGGDEE